MPTMLELGRRYGGLAFTCDRDFATVGGWVRTTPEAVWQVRFADHCHRFAFHAGRLRRLVPAIAGLAVEDQLRPPDDLVPLDALEPPATTADRVAALAGHWRVLDARYRELLATANPVSDAPAVRWLRLLAADAVDAAEGLARPG